VAHARPPVGEGRRPNAEEDAVLGRLGEAEIEDVLRTATIGRIGCRDGDSVYVVPISFVYTDGCAYGHSAEGRQLTLMRATPEVCFEVEDVRRLSD
jgi:nitroimidazol reductase NimA-like FMN-containing flavoprotein (pyridoxamine 5'-phosphate oxidase superfamily)